MTPVTIALLTWVSLGLLLSAAFHVVMRSVPPRQPREFSCPTCGLVFVDPCCEDADEPLFCSVDCIIAADAEAMERVCGVADFQRGPQPGGCWACKFPEFDDQEGPHTCR